MKRKRGRIKYEYAGDLNEKAQEISRALFPHVKIENVACLRSFNSSSRGTIARCHALGKVMQLAMKTKAFYAIEFLSERFDKMPEDEQTKVIIHELMHIPKSFGGGFIHHDVVNDNNVEFMFQKYEKLKKQGNNENKNWW
ncbi:MAG: putative metallopeptidase [Candidatus Pacearchaeota archaeon]